MSTRTAEYLEAVDHLPDGATLVLLDYSWEDYERLLDDLSDRRRLRISYDRGRLEIMTPLPEHETYSRFIDRAARFSSTMFRTPSIVCARPD
jgi:Uma2 family endonuclease